MKKLKNTIKYYYKKLLSYYNKRVNTTEKKKLFLGIVFLCVIVILLLIGILISHKSPPVNTGPNQTTIYFQPQQFSISAGAVGNYTFPIYIKSGTNQVSGVQLKMSYDPKIFTNVFLGQRGFLGHGNVLINKTDPIKGTLNYAIGISPNSDPATEDGIFADLHFTLKPNVTFPTYPHITSFAFTPGTAVGDQSYQFSTLSGAYGLVINLTK